METPSTFESRKRKIPTPTKRIVKRKLSDALDDFLGFEISVETEPARATTNSQYVVQSVPNNIEPSTNSTVITNGRHQPFRCWQCRTARFFTQKELEIHQIENHKRKY